LGPKAPSTAGIITFTPGSGGFTIDQGSHNPVTYLNASATTGGLGLSTQEITFQEQHLGTNGYLTFWWYGQLFNGKENALHFQTGLTRCYQYYYVRYIQLVVKWRTNYLWWYTYYTKL